MLIQKLISPDNDQILMNISDPGTIVGDVSLVDDGIRAYTCTALENCSVYSVPNSFMRHLAANSLEFSQFINQALTAKLRTAMHCAYRSRFSSKTQQLADMLLELHSVLRSDTLSITHTQLGHLIGCSRPTIISKLKSFEKKGLIRMRYGRIKIEDKQSLHTIANHHLCQSIEQCLF